MPITKEELQERSQLLRAYEASCHVDYPTKDELNFRIALMKKLGAAFSLREVRDKEIAGPVTEDPRATPTPGRVLGTNGKRV